MKHQLSLKFFTLLFSFFLFTLSSTITATAASDTQEKLLFTTKYEYPTSKSEGALYSGFATRVSCIGDISSVEIYYVLSEDSELYSRLLDTDLNEIACSSKVNVSKGVGLQKFTFPSYEYSGDDIYISLESNKQSLGVGSVENNNAISLCISANNTIEGLQNAVCYQPGNPLKKRTGSAQTFSLYISVYGKRTDIPVSEETKNTYHVTADKNVYISNSTGIDKPTAGSKKTPYKTISYALKQHGNNTVYSLKRGDTFYLQYGLHLSGLNNVVFNSYGTGHTASICGLRPFTPVKTSDDLYTCSISDEDIGLLFVNNTPQWRRKTLDNNLNSRGQYYFDKTSKLLSFYYTSDINSAYYATPYTGILIDNCTDLTIDDLSVSFFGRLGIRAGENCSNIHITNNTVHDIGGATMNENVKYGNGIELWLSNLNSVMVSKNTVYNCFDAGITGQVHGDATYTNKDINFVENTVSNCRYNFEYFNSSHSDSVCEVKVSNNILKNSIDITNGLRERAETDFGGFFCTWNSNGENDSVIIENNICENSDAACIGLRDDSHGKIKFLNNTFSGYKNAIVYDYNFYGEGNVF